MELLILSGCILLFLLPTAFLFYRKLVIVLQIYVETLRSFWLQNQKGKVLKTILTGNLIKELNTIIEQNRKVALQGLWTKQQELADFKNVVLQEIKKLND